MRTLDERILAGAERCFGGCDWNALDEPEKARRLADARATVLGALPEFFGAGDDVAALAEALREANLMDVRSGYNVLHWADLSAVTQKYWLDMAARLLSALPTVGLRIGRVEE